MATSRYIRLELIGRLYLDNPDSVKEFKKCRLKIYLDDVKYYITHYKLGKKKLHLIKESSKGLGEIIKIPYNSDTLDEVSAEWDY